MIRTLIKRSGNIIRISENVPMYTYANKTGIDKIIVEKENLTIERFAFRNTDVKTIELKSKTIIEKGAFSHCQRLRELHLPPKVIIEDDAFRSCYYLKDVTREDECFDLYATQKIFEYTMFNERVKNIISGIDMNLTIFYTSIGFNLFSHSPLVSYIGYFSLGYSLLSLWELNSLTSSQIK